MSETVSWKGEQRDDCLVIQVQGRDVLERSVAVVQEIAAAIRARPVRATLIDIRSVPGPVSFMDRFQLGEAAGRYLPRVRLGIVMRPEQADPKRIGQLAALNRGVWVEVFTEPAEAEAWLKKAPPLGDNPPVI